MRHIKKKKKRNLHHSRDLPVQTNKLVCGNIAQELCGKGAALCLAYCASTVLDIVPVQILSKTGEQAVTVRVYSNNSKLMLDALHVSRVMSEENFGRFLFFFLFMSFQDRCSYGCVKNFVIRFKTILVECV
jgi:hypothetical protein